MDKQKKNARQSAWNKENTVFIGIRLQKSTDPDIIEYLEDKPKQTTIKNALRLLIKSESKKQPSEGEKKNEQNTN